MVWIHQENLQLYFEDVNYFDRFLWWDICLVRMALQINSNLAVSSALSSAPSTWKSDTCPHSDGGTTEWHPASAVSTMNNRQDKAKMKQVQDTALSTIEYWRITEVRDARILRQTMDTSGWRLVQVQTYINIFFHKARRKICQVIHLPKQLFLFRSLKQYCLLSQMFGSYAIKWLSCGFYVNLLSIPSNFLYLKSKHNLTSPPSLLDSQKSSSSLALAIAQETRKTFT